MLEPSIIRAGNLLGITERIFSRAVGGSILSAKSHLLKQTVDLVSKSGDAYRIAWGDVCPFAKIVFEALPTATILDFESALTDYINTYERVLHHQILTSDFPMRTEFFPLDTEGMNLLLSETIAGRTFQEYIKEIIKFHGDKVLKTCELSVVQRLTGPEFIVSFGNMVSDQMESLKENIETCFLAYSSTMMRKLNEAVTEALSDAINADSV